MLMWLTTPKRDDGYSTCQDYINLSCGTKLTFEKYKVYPRQWESYYVIMNFYGQISIWCMDSEKDALNLVEFIKRGYLK